MKGSAVVEELVEPQPTHQEIIASLNQGQRRFAMLDKKLDHITEALAPLAQMKADIEDTKKEVAKTREIVEAWGALKTVGRLVRWIAATVTSILGAVALVAAVIKYGISDISK